MGKLDEILESLGLYISLEHLYQFDETNLIKDGFVKRENYYENGLKHEVFEYIQISVNSDNNQIDTIIGKSKSCDNEKIITLLTALYEYSENKLSISVEDLNSHVKDFNDSFDIDGISIGIHHEIINFQIRISIPFIIN